MKPTIAEMDIRLSDLFSFRIRRQAIVPQPSIRLVGEAARLLPFADRVLGWTKTRPAGLLPPVYTAPAEYFPDPRIAGWFDRSYLGHEGEQIVINEAYTDGLFKTSVLLHESIHWMQYHTGALIQMGSHDSEYEAYKVQMAWLATQGFDVRHEGKFFSPLNLMDQTRGYDLIADNYAWLKPWEKEYISYE